MHKLRQFRGMIGFLVMLFLAMIPATGYADVSTLMPLQVGRTWTYNLYPSDYATTPTSQAVTSITSTQVVNGSTAYVMNGFLGSTYSFQCSSDANGIRIHGYDAVDDGDYFTAIWSPAIPLLKNTSSNGTSYYNGTTALNAPDVGVSLNGSYSTTVTIFAPETVTVPAGTFVARPVYFYSLDSATYAGSQFSYWNSGKIWFADGVGIVKAEGYSDIGTRYYRLASTNFQLPTTSTTTTKAPVTTTTTTKAPVTTTTTTKTPTTTTTIPGATFVNLPVNAGWGLYSSPIGFEVAAVFDNSMFISVWKWEDNQWGVYLPGGDPSYAIGKDFNQLTTIAPGEGFWLNSKLATNEVNIAGEEVDDENLTLNPGWNLKGLTVPKAIEVNACFADAQKIESVWKWVNGNWVVYLPGQPGGGSQYASDKGFSVLQTINVGEGFWVNSKMNGPGSVLTSPAN